MILKNDDEPPLTEVTLFPCCSPCSPSLLATVGRVGGCLSSLTLPASFSFFLGPNDNLDAFRMMRLDPESRHHRSLLLVRLRVGDDRGKVDRRHMQALEPALDLAVLHLHPVQHAADVRLDDRRRFCRRSGNAATKNKKMTTNLVRNDPPSGTTRTRT
jgi:hypothetical protein